MPVAGGTSTAPVAKANTVSPSSGVCAGRSVRASPSCAAIATRRHAAGLSAASVATTAIVVFSELNGDGSCASASICSAGGGVQRELADQLGHPRQAGGRVDGFAGGVHHYQRADRHAGRQGDRRRPHAPFSTPTRAPTPAPTVPTVTGAASPDPWAASQAA